MAPYMAHDGFPTGPTGLYGSHWSLRVPTGLYGSLLVSTGPFWSLLVSTGPFWPFWTLLVPKVGFIPFWSLRWVLDPFGGILTLLVGFEGF